MKKLLAAAAVVAGSAMAGVGAYGLIKSSKNKCMCTCNDSDDEAVSDADVADLDGEDEVEE